MVARANKLERGADWRWKCEAREFGRRETEACYRASSHARVIVRCFLRPVAWRVVAMKVIAVRCRIGYRHFRCLDAGRKANRSRQRGYRQGNE